jgi:hypothetical protein
MRLGHEAVPVQLITVVVCGCITAACGFNLAWYVVFGLCRQAGATGLASAADVLHLCGKVTV